MLPFYYRVCGLPMDNLVDAELLKKIQFSVSQKLSSVNNSLDRGGTLCLLLHLCWDFYWLDFYRS